MIGTSATKRLEHDVMSVTVRLRPVRYGRERLLEKVCGGHEEKGLDFISKPHPLRPGGQTMSI